MHRDLKVCVCVCDFTASGRRKPFPVISDSQEVLPIVWSRLRDVGQDELETAIHISRPVRYCVCVTKAKKMAFELHASSLTERLGAWSGGVLYVQASVTSFSSAERKRRRRRRGEKMKAEDR